MNDKDIIVGRSYLINKNNFEKTVKMRFLAIGFLKNEKFKIIRKNIKNSIFVVEIKGSMFALRKSEIDLIDADLCE